VKHVFVETNWVVAYAAPAHLRLPAALTLAEKAERGELRLYIPSACFTEARYPIRTKFHRRTPADSLRKYLAWATSEGAVDPEDCAIVRRVLDRYEAAVLTELDNLDVRLRSLKANPGIEVFTLRDEILVRAVELSIQNMDLKPFDQAILAAVLVRAEELRAIRELTTCLFASWTGTSSPGTRTGVSSNPLPVFTILRCLGFRRLRHGRPASSTGVSKVIRNGFEGLRNTLWSPSDDRYSKADVSPPAANNSCGGDQHQNYLDLVPVLPRHSQS
jgi:hypothetical protein